MKPLPSLLASALLAFALALPLRAAPLDFTSATIPELQSAFAAGTLSSEKLTAAFLARIAAYDQAGPKLNTVITLNPKALEVAKAL
ncbi:MAG: hypothetical protein NTV51_02515, partial [Verrucomicrobia bacterium]|nr:hypothetical protein [Verrucomicrobiota bacterium]